MSIMWKRANFCKICSKESDLCKEYFSVVFTNNLAEAQLRQEN